MLTERTDTIRWEVGGRNLRPEDAGIWKYCDYCGSRYDIEKLTVDERGFWACPSHLFDPQPEPFDLA